MNYKIYKNILDNDFIISILEKINYSNFHPGKVGGNRVNLNQKKRKDLFIDNNNLLQLIDTKIYTELYTDINQHFSNIIFREQWKLGFYSGEDQSFYNIHTDTAGDTLYRKTSMVVMLSNKTDYEGGEFYFKDLNIDLKLDKGDVLVFQSKLLHGVKPVTKGERNVLISFFFDNEGMNIKKKFNNKLNYNNYVPMIKNNNFNFIKDTNTCQINKGDIDYSDLHNNPWNQSNDYLFENNYSDILIISFSGMGWKNSIPTFNFYNMFKSYKFIDKLFLRDIKCKYYLTGLQNNTKTFQETIEFIKKLTEVKQYRKIIAIGCSSGGFAAILYGHLLKFTKVIAFSPQVVLTQTKEDLIHDIYNAPKTCKYLRDLNKENELYQDSLDLKNFLPLNTEVDIHYACNANKGSDKKHALYLQSKKCKIFEYDSNNHMIALELRDKGILKKIIENELDQNKIIEIN